MKKIKNVIILTMISAEKKMLNRFRNTYQNRNTFYEVYGFDILITEKMRPYLIEVNQCPSMNMKTNIDRQIKMPLFSDVMNLIGFTPDVIKKNKTFNNIEDTEENLVRISGMTAENCIHILTVQDWNVLFEFDEEFNRKGNFERIFPNKENVVKYSDIFSTKRYNNLLL